MIREFNLGYEFDREGNPGPCGRIFLLLRNVPIRSRRLFFEQDYHRTLVISQFSTSHELSIS